MTETTKSGVTQRYCTGPAFVRTVRCNYRERGLDRLFGILDFSPVGLGIGCCVFDGLALRECVALPRG